MPDGLAWADGTVVQVREVDTSDVRDAVVGVDYKIRYTLDGGTPDDGYLLPLALLDDGKLVVSSVPVGAYEGGDWLLKPATVGTYDGTTFTPYAPTPAIDGDHPRQAYAAAVDGDTVVWAETASTDLYQSNWRIFTVGGDGETRILARSEDIQSGDLPLVDGDTTPVVASGRGYWATAVPITSPGGEYRSDVVSQPLDGSGDSRVEAEGASSPAPTSRGLVVVQDQRDDPSLEGKAPKIGLVTRPGTVEPFLTTGSDWDVHVDGLTSAGSRIAFVLARPSGSGDLYVVDVEAHDAWHVALTSSTASIALCGSRLAWSEADASGTGGSVPVYSLDLESGELRRIDVADAFEGVMCAGPFLSWQTLAAGAARSASTVVASWL